MVARGLGASLHPDFFVSLIRSLATPHPILILMASCTHPNIFEPPPPPPPPKKNVSHFMLICTYLGVCVHVCVCVGGGGGEGGVQSRIQGFGIVLWMWGFLICIVLYRDLLLTPWPCHPPVQNTSHPSIFTSKVRVLYIKRGNLGGGSTSLATYPCLKKALTGCFSDIQHLHFSLKFKVLVLFSGCEDFWSA